MPKVKDETVQDEETNTETERVGAAGVDERAERERGWTAQHGTALPDEARTANQKFVESQLPDPDVARAAGIHPQNIPEHLVLSDDEAFSHPLGPEPGERERLEQRDAIKATLEQAGAGPQPRGRTNPGPERRPVQVGGDPNIGEGPSDSSSEAQRENAAFGSPGQTEAPE